MNDTREKTPVGKREARKQDRREAILAVAKRSFLENGYSATSMSAIAAELGGSKGTLWSYFPSKEELFAAVVEQATSAYRQELAALLQPASDLHDAIRRFCRSFLFKITSADALCLHRLIASEGGRFPEIGEIFHRRAPLATQTLLAAYLEQHMQAGHLRREDPLRAARTLTSLCMGGVHQRMLWGLSVGSSHEIEQEAAFAAEVFFRAFGPAEQDGRG